MIPKKIHYVWVGGKDKPTEVVNCIESWKKYCPDYEIKEWNETNFDINKYKYSKQAYEQKKWAFVSDVIRLYALYTEGGIYLDTDVEAYKPLDEFLSNKAFTGFENVGYPVTAVMGAEKGNPIIKQMLDYYKNKEFTFGGFEKTETNTMIMSNILEQNGIDRNRNEFQKTDNITIYPKDTFCPNWWEDKKESYTKHLMLGTWTGVQKKLIIWQSYICEVGGVETFLYNFCTQLRNYYDIEILYGEGNEQQISRLRKIVKLRKYDRNKEYIADICLRNSVWGNIPYQIKARKYIEMQHTDYMHLKEIGQLDKQVKVWDKIDTHIACGEFVRKKYKEATGNDSITIRNILAPKKEVDHIYRLISCMRIDNRKGWDRMQQMCKMMRNVGIKFVWDIFTNSTPRNTEYEEIRFWKHRYDIFDYVANADYCVLLSDAEGLPYTVQEALQYDTPCIVTDVGGCTELIKDGINGYVVPLDMNFDINRIKKIPKIKNYENNALDKWLEVLGEPVYIEKEEIKEMKVKVEVLRQFTDTELGREVKKGEIYIMEKERAETIVEQSSKTNRGPVISIIENIVEKAVKEPIVEKAITRRRNAKKQ